MGSSKCCARVSDRNNLFACADRSLERVAGASDKRQRASNGYLAFTAMLMAGLDGIQNRIDPGKPIDKNLYDLPPVEAKEVKSTPGSLEQALDALEADHAFLLRGDVFTKDVIETWLSYKRDKEIDAIRLRPHPYEFHLYYDI